MAQKSVSKQAGSAQREPSAAAPKIGARPMAAAAPRPSEPARRVAVTLPRKEATPPSRPVVASGLLPAWFSKAKPEDTMTENLAAVKTGVLHELETLSAQKGTPVTGSPFSTIVLPPRARSQKGLKWLVLLLFLALFLVIMFLAGQRAPLAPGSLAPLPPTGAGTPVAEAPVASAPLSRADVQSRQMAPVEPMLKVLAATRVSSSPDSLVLTLALGNLGSQPIPAGPVHLTITDAAGQPMKQATLALDEALEAGKSRRQTWTIPLVPTNRLDHFVATLPLGALQVHVRPGE